MMLKRFFSTILMAAAVPVIVAQQPELVVAGSLRLTAVSDGFDGRLELLEDARLSPDLKKELWGSGGPEVALDPKDPLYKDLTAVPLQKAVLQLMDAHGKVIAEKTLERELARMGFVSLRPGKRTILVTTDLSAGFGSYSGPDTELLEVSEGGLESVVAKDSKSGLSEPIRLASTLKIAWRLVPAAGGVNGQKDILEFACRPADWGALNSGFVLIYTRYHWNGKGWTEFNRRVHGFWESDEGFPPLARFPSASGN
ncbi:MAG: hypothetical protein ABR912_12595 [Terracidiphilus sp.]|jgi:hypothetical protein